MVTAIDTNVLSALLMGTEAESLQALEHYLAELARVREKTEKGFLELDDAWLKQLDPR